MADLEMFGYCDDENMNDFSMEDLNEFQMATTNLNHDSALHLIESLSSSSSESNILAGIKRLPEAFLATELDEFSLLIRNLVSVVINTDVNCNLKAEIVDQFCLIFFSDTNELIWNRIYNIHDPLYYENALANLEMWCLPLVSLILETSDQLPAFDEFEEYDDSSISKRKLLELKKAKHSLFLKCVSFINQLSLRFENNIGEEISIKFIQNLTSSLEDKGLMMVCRLKHLFSDQYLNDLFVLKMQSFSDTKECKSVQTIWRFFSELISVISFDHIMDNFIPFLKLHGNSTDILEVTYAWSCLFQPNFQYAQLKPHLHYFLNEIYPQLSYPCKGIFLARSNVIFSFYLNGFEIDEEYKLMVKTLLTGLENIRLFNATTQCSLLNGLCTSLNVFTLNDDKITIPWDSIWYPISCLQVSSNKEVVKSVSKIYSCLFKFKGDSATHFILISNYAKFLVIEENIAISALTCLSDLMDQNQIVIVKDLLDTCCFNSSIYSKSWRFRLALSKLLSKLIIFDNDVQYLSIAIDKLLHDSTYVVRSHAMLLLSQFIQYNSSIAILQELSESSSLADHRVFAKVSFELLLNKNEFRDEKTYHNVLNNFKEFIVNHSSSRIKRYIDEDLKNHPDLALIINN